MINSRMIMYVCLASLLSVPVPATSETGPRTLTFKVSAQGGVYHVPVYKDIVTVLAFSSKVKVADGYNMEGLEFALKSNLVVVRPLEKAVSKGTISVSWSGVTVVIIFDIVDDVNDAAMAAHFSVLDEETHMITRIHDQVRIESERLHLTYRQKYDQFDAVVEKRVVKRIAEGLRQQRTFDISKGDRTDDHVIGKIQRLVWIGQSACLHLQIANHSKKMYQIDDIAIHVHGNRLPSVSSWRPSSETKYQGDVLPDESERGVVCVTDARRWRGRRVVLVVNEAKSKNRRLRFQFKLRS